MCLLYGQHAVMLDVCRYFLVLHCIAGPLHLKLFNSYDEGKLAIIKHCAGVTALKN